MNEFLTANLIFDIFILFYSLSFTLEIICILKLLEEERKERNETRNYVIK